MDKQVITKNFEFKGASDFAEVTSSKDKDALNFNIKNLSETMVNCAA